MNYKCKTHDFPGFFGVSSKHMLLLGFLLTLPVVPVVYGRFVVVLTVVFKPNVGRCLYGRQSCSSLT